MHQFYCKETCPAWGSDLHIFRPDDTRSWVSIDANTLPEDRERRIWRVRSILKLMTELMRLHPDRPNAVQIAVNLMSCAGIPIRFLSENTNICRGASPEYIRDTFDVHFGD